jgi:hypothetical protein
MAKGRAKPIRLKPAERDTFGKAFDTWPESAWQSPKKHWSLNLFRESDGHREEKKFEATYEEMVKLRAEYLATGLYYKAITKFGFPVGNDRKWG